MTKTMHPEGGVENHSTKANGVSLDELPRSGEKEAEPRGMNQKDTSTSSMSGSRWYVAAAIAVGVVDVTNVDR